MQYYYSYDKNTNEYIGQGVADLNPEASKREGKEVYFAPAYATLKKPPSVKENQIPIFEVNKWVIKADYRGCYICDELLNILIVQNIGDLPENYIIITEEQALQIKNDPLWYVVQNGELIKNPNYDKQKEEQRREYLSHLAMTKYDFYKFVCQPNNISYNQLVTLVNSNDEIATAWNLCGHVYRGDDTLCTYIKQFLPTVTSDVLDEIFEQHGKIINE